jgi:hypothetical protein
MPGCPFIGLEGERGGRAMEGSDGGGALAIL